MEMGGAPIQFLIIRENDVVVFSGLESNTEKYNYESQQIGEGNIYQFRLARKEVVKIGK